MQRNVKPHLKAMNGLHILELVQICTAGELVCLNMSPKKYIYI